MLPDESSEEEENENVTSFITEPVQLNHKGLTNS